MKKKIIVALICLMPSLLFAQDNGSVKSSEASSSNSAVSVANLYERCKKGVEAKNSTVIQILHGKSCEEFFGMGKPAK